MKRKAALLLAVVLLLLSFSGCTINLFSVESLMMPPEQIGKNGEVQKAFNRLMSEKTVLLKTPSKGEYRTAFTLRDVNGDGSEEAVVFYADNAVDATVHMVLMQCLNDTWVIASDVAGSGSSVYDLDFIDMNSDGRLEIVVGWALFDNKTTRTVTVYAADVQADNVLALRQELNEYYNARTFVDFNGDGVNDLVLVYLDDTGDTQKAYLRNFTMTETGTINKYNEFLLDSSVTSVVKMQYDSPPDSGITRLFIDCVKTDNTIFTEVICWNPGTMAPVRAISNPSTATLRSQRAGTRDIDGDGLFEVPAAIKLSGTDESLSVTVDDVVYTFTLLNWLNIRGDAEGQPMVTLLNTLDSYLFVFPYGSSVTVRYDRYRRALLFCEWDSAESAIRDELFSIAYRSAAEEATTNEATTAAAAADSQPAEPGKILYKNDTGVYYFAITEYGRAADITDSDIMSAFIRLD